MLSGECRNTQQRHVVGGVTFRNQMQMMWREELGEVCLIKWRILTSCTWLCMKSGAGVQHLTRSGRSIFVALMISMLTFLFSPPTFLTLLYAIAGVINVCVLHWEEAHRDNPWVVSLPPLSRPIFNSNFKLHQTYAAPFTTALLEMRNSWVCDSNVFECEVITLCRFNIIQSRHLLEGR